MQFIDLAAQQKRLRTQIDARIAAVLDHGAYIMGPEVNELEEKLALFCGAKHCVSCANGTDALLLVLMALEVGENDAIFVPSFTFAATAEVAPAVGATPFFVDIDPDTFNIDPTSLNRSIEAAKEQGLNPRAVIPVDLFGQPANYPVLDSIAANENLLLIADSAQGWGGTIDNRMTGTYGVATTTSFFPAKPLGCYGDGGAIFTDDPDLASLLQSLRAHGKGREKYDNARIGQNSRLDTLQAAILLEKLSIFEDELAARQTIAARYSANLSTRYQVPFVPENMKSIWAQYTLKAKDSEHRAATMATLKDAGIPSGVYYPKPLHQQTAYQHFPTDPEGLPNSEDAATRAFSLPMHPYLTTEDQDKIITVLTK